MATWFPEKEFEIKASRGKDGNPKDSVAPSLKAEDLGITNSYDPNPAMQSKLIKPDKVNVPLPGHAS